MSENKCKNCGAELLEGARFCSKCRSAVEASAPETDNTGSNCPSCGAALLPGAKFCSKCRSKVAADETALQQPVNPFQSVQNGAAPTAQSEPVKRSKAVFVGNIVLAACCAGLVICGIIFIPGRIKKVRTVEKPDEFIVVDDELTDELIEEYSQVNAQIDAGIFPDNEESEPVRQYEDYAGYYEWMNRNDEYFSMNDAEDTEEADQDE